MTPQQEGRAGVRQHSNTIPFAFHNISYANSGYRSGRVPSGFRRAICSDVRRATAH